MLESIIKISFVVTDNIERMTISKHFKKISALPLNLYYPLIYSL